MRQPILTNEDLEKIRSISDDERQSFQVAARSTSPSRPSTAPPAWAGARSSCASRAEKAVRDGINIIILSDRKAGAERMPIPALLACAAVHHHLIREGLRTSVGLVVETGEPREVHHFACLAGYGAEAINPYLAFETLIAMKDDAAAEARRQGNRQALHQVDRQGPAEGDVQDGHLDLSVLLRRADFRRGRPAARISSTPISPAPHTRIEGVGLAEIAEETVRRHRDAFGDSPIYRIDARRRRRLCRPRARRGPCLDRRDGARPAACGARQFARSTTAPSPRS